MHLREILTTGVTARLPGDYALQGSQGQDASSDAPAGHGGAGKAIWQGNVLTIIIPGMPVGKPRMTRRDKWAQRPAVMRYRQWADKVREIAGAVPSAEKVMSLSWTACFEPPKSWSKRRRADIIGMWHRQPPDRDNIDKAVLDALYPNGDQGIAHGTIAKCWDWNARLEIRIEAIE